MREAFYDLYGSLFFLGIMLSIVFLLAAVLIIYYKQISEGYEDHARFEIMQKVGMTKKDIRKSINSQMLTVFFMPLIFAGIHLVFAFPFLSKILVLFAMDNILLTAIVNLICFAAFGFFYAIVYKLKIDSHTFLAPSKPSHIGFVLDETLVTTVLVDEIVKLLCDEQKKYVRVCFIGTDKKIQKMFRDALHNRSRFAFAFINDFEQAKEWLVSESV